MSHRRYQVLRARLALALTLVGASVLLAGCGDGAHLPAGMNGASGASGGDALSSVLGADPGSQLASQSSSLDDPVLGDYAGINDVDALGEGDMWANAESDFYDDGAGSALSTASLDTPLMDDPYADGYGYGRNTGYGNDGWGGSLGYGGLANSYGYGNGVIGGVGMASYGMAGLGGMADGGMIDPTIGDFDPTFDDLGGSIDDPSIGIGAADTSIDDGMGGLGGFDFGSPMDLGGSDLGGSDFGSGPVDFGGADIGGFDAAPVEMGGFDGGAVDVSPIDMGGMDVGGAIDTGGFDTGGFDVGAGGMDIGGMDAGFGF